VEETVLKMFSYMEETDNQFALVSEFQSCTICQSIMRPKKVPVTAIHVCTTGNGKVGLADLIAASSTSTGGTFKCPNENCAGHKGTEENNMTTRNEVCTTPAILIVSVKRNIFNVRSETEVLLDDHVKLPACPPHRGETKYTVDYIIFHMSAEASSGHFYGSKLLDEDKFRVFNDGRTRTHDSGAAHYHRQRAREVCMVVLRKMPPDSQETDDGDHDDGSVSSTEGSDDDAGRPLLPEIDAFKAQYKKKHTSRNQSRCSRAKSRRRAQPLK
jgi:hypothetical protein